MIVGAGFTPALDETITPQTDRIRCGENIAKYVNYQVLTPPHDITHCTSEQCKSDLCLLEVCNRYLGKETSQFCIRVDVANIRKVLGKNKMSANDNVFIAGRSLRSQIVTSNCLSIGYTLTPTVQT